METMWEIPLFGKKPINDYIEEIKSAMKVHIERQNEVDLLNVDENKFKENLFKTYSRQTPIINEKNIRTTKERSGFDGKNYCILEIPFEGNQILFELKPSNSKIDYYSVGVSESLIKIRIPFEENSQNMKREVDKKLDTLKCNLNYLGDDLNKFNIQLKELIETQFNSRKQKILKENEVLVSLGFPLKERSDASRTYVLPEIKRKISIQKPKASSKSIVPEPIISDEDYENILNIIDDMSKVMERSPSAFKNMGEEDLRIHFLVQLNGRYEGQATGETFNLEGKTDILIRHEGKNIFIAECKFWYGKKKLLEAIDQLLRYVSWRDTKTSIILFNKNKDSSKVLEQIPTIVREHQNYVKQEEYEKENSFRFIMKNKNDEGKHFILTIKLFDVPN